MPSDLYSIYLEATKKAEEPAKPKWDPQMPKPGEPMTNGPMRQPHWLQPTPTAPTPEPTRIETNGRDQYPVLDTKDPLKQFGFARSQMGQPLTPEEEERYRKLLALHEASFKPVAHIKKK